MFTVHLSGSDPVYVEADDYEVDEDGYLVFWADEGEVDEDDESILTEVARFAQFVGVSQ